MPPLHMFDPNSAESLEETANLFSGVFVEEFVSFCLPPQIIHVSLLC